MTPENKYSVWEKAVEYAEMSWPQVGKNALSEPFYLHINSLLRRAVSLCGSGNLTCVEAGIGAGRGLFELSRFEQVSKIVGLDLSISMVDVSRSILVDGHDIDINGARLTGMGFKNIEFLQTDIQDCGLRSGVAEVTLCINVLDRVPKVRKAIKELIRITKTGGYLVVATAFDYEAVTPIKEQLGLSAFEDTFVKNGCKIVLRETAELLKQIGIKHGIKRYEESCVILKKETN